MRLGGGYHPPIPLTVAYLAIFVTTVATRGTCMKALPEYGFGRLIEFARAPLMW
jgi:hypothetical protein